MATKRKNSNKKIKLNEFKAWLEGVEELQPEDWSPTPDQWLLIRQKINNIILPKAALAEHQPTPQARVAPPTPVVASSIAPPPLVGGIQDPQAAAMMQTAGGTGKTPDVDTSDGNINSSFA